jgi:DNA helicase-2/ATP-dependent DNA helicase PcrA
MAGSDVIREESYVIGPPGAGKTETIKRWCARLVRDREYAPDDILLTSFGKAAAKELGERIDIPSENTATLHALAYRAIGAPPIAETEPLASEWNRGRSPAWCTGTPPELDDIGAAMNAGADDQYGSLLSAYSRARALQCEEGHPLMERTKGFRREWEAFKKNTGSIDFSDMIERATVETDEAPGGPAVIMVDEAQDLSPAQGQLVRKWSDSPRVEKVVLVGDPAQAIYTFAGADPTILMRGVVGKPPAERHLLGTEQTYRLPSNIKDFAETWLRRHRSDITTGRTWAPRCEGGAVDRMVFSWRHPEGLLAEVEHELAKGRTCMVLATCAYLLTPITQFLRHAGLPFWNPYKPKHGPWNPLARGRDGTTGTTERLLAFYRDPWRWRDVASWAAMLPASGAQNVFTERGTKKALELKGRGEESQNIVDVARDVMPLFKPAAFDAIMNENLTWLSANALLKYQRPLQYAVRVFQRHGKTALSLPPKITVGTGHSVKGGEADTVFCLPDISQVAFTEMFNKGVDETDAMVRLGYVMATRAKKRLVLGHAHNPLRDMGW